MKVYLYSQILESTAKPRDSYSHIYTFYTCEYCFSRSDQLFIWDSGSETYNHFRIS